ncbi:MAG TPA: hypothetical protein VJB70_04360 [Candidatus Paceibacterota bacterium]
MRFCFEPLPKSFVLYKPAQRESYDIARIYELEKHDELIITRKRDGWKLFVVKAGDKWKVYTDGMREVTSYVPDVVQELRGLPVANGTVYVCEGIVDEDDSDNFSLVGSILNSRTAERAIARQLEIGFIQCMPFEIAFKNGGCSLELPYHERLSMIQETFQSSFLFLSPVPVLDMSFDDAQKLVSEKGWEGLVLYAKDFVGSYRIDGKAPRRPNGCYKWKPIFEDDFFAREWIPYPEYPDRLKEVKLLQVDQKTGKEVDCGVLGTLSVSMREELRKKFTRKKSTPVVLQVAFEARNPSGKLRNKRFVRIRKDKKWDECFCP